MENVATLKEDIIYDDMTIPKRYFGIVVSDDNGMLKIDIKGYGIVEVNKNKVDLTKSMQYYNLDKMKEKLKKTGIDYSDIIDRIDDLSKREVIGNPKIPRILVSQECYKKCLDPVNCQCEQNYNDICNYDGDITVGK